MTAMIEVEKLRKEFDIKNTRHKLVAVDDITFRIGESETYGLIGESGSGKTTVGRILLRLIEPTTGAMRYNGLGYEAMGRRQFAPIQREMQMVFQDPYYSLNPTRTVWDTVASSCHAAGAERRRLIEEALDRVQIASDNYGKYPHQISMGAQQRVGIARAIVSKPKFIVLDEPTSSLDLTVRGEIMNLLTALQNQLRISYLFISHDLSTIQHMCHRVSIMYLGQIVESGTVEQIFHQRTHPYSQALLASVMHPDPARKRPPYRLSGEIPSPINLLNACYLANRCPEATDVCFAGKPGVKEVAPGHTVRCHLR